MAIVIQEVTHEVGETGAETRGVGRADGNAAAVPSEAVLEALALAAIRREASRAARLWAD